MSGPARHVGALEQAAALTEGDLAAYLARRDEQRRDTLNRVLAAMTPRELALVREVAVMANVRGTLRAGRTMPLTPPSDAAVLADTLLACLAMPDLYPTIATLLAYSPDEGEPS